MWTRELFGTDVYHLISWFIIYSVLGWMAESIYMSFCNKKITNRGFAKSPFCPIYGFGAVGASLLFKPISGNYVLLYISGALLATFFEFLVAKLMIRLFGEVWWDYHDKPCNYKGIVCLESTIAWGFYTVFLFLFLHNIVTGLVNQYPISRGKQFCKAVLVIVAVDFIYHFLAARGFDFGNYKERAVNTCRRFRARF